MIEKEIGVDLTGCERYIDTYTIRHTLKNHGFATTEEKRGQVVITLDDFQLIPSLIENAQKIKYIGKNKRKQDVFEYHTISNGRYIILEAVRIRTVSYTHLDVYKRQCLHSGSRYTHRQKTI